MLHTLDDFGEIRRRARRIRVSLKELADAAGLDSANLYRAGKHGRDILSRNCRKLDAALSARERTLLCELAELHPDLIADLAAHREAAE